MAACTRDQTVDRIVNDCAEKPPLGPKKVPAEHKTAMATAGSNPRCEACGREVPAANAQLHEVRCARELGKGCCVFYYDKRDGLYKEAVVTAIDRSLQPPAYSVEIAGGAERETERSRLFVNIPTDASEENVLGGSS